MTSYDFLNAQRERCTQFKLKGTSNPHARAAACGPRSLRDGVESPLERVPCAVAVVLAKGSEALASSPGSEIYRVVNRCGF